VISEVGHVSIRVRDLDAAEEVATNVMGLTVTDRSPDEVWLSPGSPHHNLHYVRSEVDMVNHVGLVAPDAESVSDIQARVSELGWEIERDAPDGPGVRDGFLFVGPEGARFEIYSDMSSVEVDHKPHSGVRPLRFGHVNFAPHDAVAMRQMFIELFDFRVSDYAGEGAFLRCNVDHHGVGVFPGSGLLHHYAWEVSSLIELGALADLIDQRGQSVLWGPARHGIGRNIATYFQDPSGVVVEYYTEMERIYDDEHHKPKHWELEGHKWFSLWGPQLPDGFVELGIPFSGRGT